MALFDTASLPHALSLIPVCRHPPADTTAPRDGERIHGLGEDWLVRGRGGAFEPLSWSPPPLPSGLP